MKMRVLASFIVWVSTTLNQRYIYAQPAIYMLNAQPVIHIYSTSNICLTNYIED